jgi:prepilin-type N-terminal cleavage/methylation domain-containing protein
MLRLGSQWRQRGLSLVELMVGITIGLVVVAGASVLLSGQLFENRRLIAEAQVNQDLRATADIITRELRRAGAIGVDVLLVSRVWEAGTTNDAADNRWARLLTPAAGAPADDEVAFNYYPTGPGTDGPFGFRLNAATGVIQTRLRAGGWQDLTDPATVNVTEFEIERLADTRVTIPCAKPCPAGPWGAAGTSACWPTVSVRAVEVRITVEHRTIPAIQRSHRSQVRLRNDHIAFFDQSPWPDTKLCPP